MSTLVSEQEMARRRKLRQERNKVADRHNIAVGWVSPSLEIWKQANGADPPQLPKPPRDAA